jgi:hypothetical protein
MPTVDTYRKQQADPERWPLFVLQTGVQERAAVAVVRNGTRYYVPRGAAGGRSMNCFTLVTQILALHKSRDTLPTTQTVIGVGGP